jgi:lipid-binding SYLF domain-containing protein
MMPPRSSSELHQTHLTGYPQRSQPRQSAWGGTTFAERPLPICRPAWQGCSHLPQLEGWSAPAFFTLSDGLWLPRFGVTEMSLIVVVMGQNARQLLSTKRIEIGTDVSAIGGPIGRHVAPENYYRLNREMLTYSISKGALAPVSLEGATIREDRRSLVAIYGRAAVMQAALSGRLPVPPAARPFLAVVDGIVQRKSIP